VGKYPVNSECGKIYLGRRYVTLSLKKGKVDQNKSGQVAGTLIWLRNDALLSAFQQVKYWNANMQSTSFLITLDCV
jgi:hypothetical protein